MSVTVTLNVNDPDVGSVSGGGVKSTAKYNGASYYNVDSPYTNASSGPLSGPGGNIEAWSTNLKQKYTIKNVSSALSELDFTFDRVDFEFYSGIDLSSYSSTYGCLIGAEGSSDNIKQALYLNNGAIKVYSYGKNIIHQEGQVTGGSAFGDGTLYKGLSWRFSGSWNNQTNSGSMNVMAYGKVNNSWGSLGGYTYTGTDSTPLVEYTSGNIECRLFACGCYKTESGGGGDANLDSINESDGINAGGIGGEILTVIFKEDILDIPNLNISRVKIYKKDTLLRDYVPVRVWTSTLGTKKIGLFDLKTGTYTLNTRNSIPNGDSSNNVYEAHIVATPNPNINAGFKGWYDENGKLYSSEADTYIWTTTDITLTAKFDITGTECILF